MRGICGGGGGRKAPVPEGMRPGGTATLPPALLTAPPPGEDLLGSNPWESRAADTTNSSELSWGPGG